MIQIQKSQILFRVAINFVEKEEGVVEAFWADKKLPLNYEGELRGLNVVYVPGFFLEEIEKFFNIKDSIKCVLKSNLCTHFKKTFLFPVGEGDKIVGPNPIPHMLVFGSMLKEDFELPHETFVEKLKNVLGTGDIEIREKDYEDIKRLLENNDVDYIRFRFQQIQFFFHPFIYNKVSILVSVDVPTPEYEVLEISYEGIRKTFESFSVKG